MREAIFQILRNRESLELMMASYQLLLELDKRFPQVYLSNVDASKSSSSTPREVVVVKEAWSPFVLGSDIASSERVRAGRNADVTLDSFIISSSILVSVFMYFLPMVGFSILLRWLVEMASDTDFKIISLKFTNRLSLETPSASN